MVFSDTTTKQGLIQDCEQGLFGDDGYGQISGNANRLYRFTQLLNEGLNKATGIILGADNRWQFDNTNYSDNPIATTNLVSGQRDYAFDVTHLKILSVQIKDTNGSWVIIQPFDMNDQNTRSYLQNNTENVGTPVRYDPFAGSIWLDPAPNYSSSGGLRIYFQRPPALFDYTDTDQTPGIPALYHRYVSKYASLEYAKDKDIMNKIVPLTNDLTEMQKEIETLVSDRNKVERPRIITHKESPR